MAAALDTELAFARPDERRVEWVGSGRELVRANPPAPVSRQDRTMAGDVSVNPRAPAPLPTRRRAAGSCSRPAAHRRQTSSGPCSILSRVPVHPVRVPPHEASPRRLLEAFLPRTVLEGIPRRQRTGDGTACEGRGKPGSQGQGRHLHLHARRIVAHRHVRPEAGPTRDGGRQGDRDQRRRRADFGVVAAAREANAPRHVRPLDDLDARRARSRQLPGPHQLLHDADDQPSGTRHLGAEAARVGQSTAARQRPDQRQPAAPG